jgi:hypothetical protein
MSKGFKGSESGRMSNKPSGYRSSGSGPDSPARFNKPVSSIKHSSVDVIKKAGMVKKGFQGSLKGK